MTNLVIRFLYYFRLFLLVLVPLRKSKWIAIRTETGKANYVRVV